MWRLYTAGMVLLMALSGWGGWALHPDVIGPSESSEKSREKVVKTITRPDGTVIREERNKQVAKQKEEAAPLPPVKDRWAIDIGLIPNWVDPTEPYWSIGLARRVANTDLWTTGAYRPDTRDLYIGLRIEF